MNQLASTPGLVQSVMFGERYVSSALNRKLSGILGAGVYHGFVVKPGGAGRVLIAHEDDYPRSVAVVERNGYSLTLVLNDPVYVELPAPGTWNIVLEALYIESEPGYQRIVAREQVEEHHVLLGTVTVTSLEETVSIEQINTASCQFSNTREQYDTLAEVYALSVDQTKLYADLSRRVFELELRSEAQGDGGGLMPPDGYQLGDARVVPVTIVPEGVAAPDNAALSISLTQVEE